MYTIFDKASLSIKISRNAIQLVLILLFSVLASACSSSEQTVSESSEGNTTPAQKDSTPPSPKWIVPAGESKTLAKRRWDLRHQKIKLHFDFTRKMVLGHTDLFLTSIINNNDSLVLDAKTIRIDSVYHTDTRRAISFSKDSLYLYLDLGRKFDRNDSLFISVSYVATPPDRGLYFVDPLQRDPAKPTQIWTLGQPEDNSYWLPTIDHPSERATQETWLSVPDSMQTLSNGRIIESRTRSADSLRTDYWLIDKPHAPYLFGFAAGNYTITKDFANDIVYRFYTESQYQPYTSLIYQGTQKAGRFLQRYLQTPYPWRVYGQAPVHNFIASGMENTTATLLHDGVQIDRQASLDIDNTNLIVHEFAHHWFGNLVTGKNWANLPLNEGFATYMEGLFLQFDKGKSAAAWHSLQNKLSYFKQADTLRRPIIFDRYHVPEDMYDAHTYGKMSRILKMLHHLVGDQEWKASVQLYLQKHAFSAVDFLDLQNAFERQTGRKLDDFFEQWLLKPGHPALHIKVDTIGNKNELRIQQVQDLERQPKFEFPLTLELVETDETIKQTIRIERVDSTYILKSDSTLTDVIVDPDDIILAEFEQEIPTKQLLARTEHNSVSVRYHALQKLADVSRDRDSLIIQRLIQVAANDPFWAIRKTAMELLGRYQQDQNLLDFAYTRTQDTESNSKVRLKALQLVNGDSTDATRRYLEKMTNDSSYFVAAKAIRIYGKEFSESGYTDLKKFKDSSSYQHLLKSAFAEVVRYSLQPNATTDLAELASDKGSFAYISHALESLAWRVNHNLTDRNTLMDTCYSRLQPDYFYHRQECLKIIEQFAQRKDVSDLEYLMQSQLPSEKERNYIWNIIRKLEPEPASPPLQNY